MGYNDMEGMTDAREMEEVASSLAGSVPGSGYPQPKDARNLSDWYMEFEEDLQHMEHWLKGEYFDAMNEHTPWKKIGEPLCNEQGVVFIMGYMRGTGLSKNKIMTTFPNWDTCMQRIRGVMFALSRALHKHVCYGDFGLTLPNSRAILSYAFDLVYSSSSRALFGNENKRVRDTSTTAQTIITGNQPGQGQNPAQPRSPLDYLHR